MRAQDADEFVNLMLMAHANDLGLLSIDTEKFASQLRTALRNPFLRALQTLSRSTEHYLVAESEGKVVGLVGLTGRKVLEVIGTAVHLDYRGQGIGKALMEAILVKAKRLGRDRLTVGVR